MNSTATHDSKRGEDTRARLNVLSEMPEEWESGLGAWHRLIRERRSRLNGAPVPDRNTEYLLYQVLIGAWPQDGRLSPGFGDRIQAYMIKAMREAGEHTSWIEPGQDYEAALAAFIDALLDPSPQNSFLAAFRPFCARIAFFGLFNALSQCLLKISAPGIPDFYQGTELLHLALVDPDNRRPVDYFRREALLKSIRDDGADPLAHTAALLASRADGRLKPYVIARALRTRAALGHLFARGRYIPLAAGGVFHRHIVAFARQAGDQWCLTAVPRLVSGLVAEGRDPLGLNVWADTRLTLPPAAPRAWRNVFTGKVSLADGGLPVAEILAHFPVALLTGAPSP